MPVRVRTASQRALRRQRSVAGRDTVRRTAATITVGLVLFTVVGCCLGLITGAPSERCPDQVGTDYSGLIRAGLFFISLFVVLTAVASIVLTWHGSHACAAAFHAVDHADAEQWDHL